MICHPETAEAAIRDGAFALEDMAAEDGEGSQPRRTCHMHRILNYYFRKTSNGATISSKTGRLQKCWVAGEARARILRRPPPLFPAG